MISYRHHIVSLVAVFLALAVGVVLGGGPLSDLGRGADAQASSATADSPTNTGAADFADSFAGRSAPTLYAGGLRDHPVALVTMPGADPATVKALTAQVRDAGGTVTGQYVAESTLLDAGDKSLVDTLGSQLATQLGGTAVTADASTYPRIGELIGLAVSTTDAAGTAAGDNTTTVRQTLAGADLMTSPKREASLAPLVLVVLGDGTAQADDAVVSGILSGLATTSGGVVVAGTASSGVSGELAALRATPTADEVTTVDSTDTTLGQVTATLALVRRVSGDGGSFGASGADGAVPLG